MVFLLRAGHSAVYKTRSMAAMALVALVPPDHLVNTLQHLLDMLPGSVKDKSQSNVVHGALMQVSDWNKG